MQKILSAYGVASRRTAEELIAAGRVTVNGKRASVGDRVSPGCEIAVDGVPVGSRSESVYIMLNKPRGYVTTVHDERGRKTVMSLVSGAGTRIYPAGRLDMDSEGLLLLTNDGRFANAAMHPSGNKLKVYEVSVRGDVTVALKIMRAPMNIGEYTVHATDVVLTSHGKDGGVLRISIGEGRNRQIRRMCHMCGLTVLTLKRVAIGRLELGSLETGEWRYLTPEERAYFE